LLGTPAIIATTLPVLAPAGTAATILVADHEEGAAATPLNDTLLPPCELPKFAPVMVTIVPAAPLDGETLERLGADGRGIVNVTSFEYGLYTPAVLYACNTK
jgi:hypothetical protein